MGAPAAAAAEDELHDLSPEDALDLRLFLDKRRWFEAKLKILESLPPIYPFLHPVLCEPSDSGAGSNSTRPVVVTDGNASLSLPLEEQLCQWQDERTALEEQVLAFDGGDLGRIKDKTRAATLLPLTPPSTHLVSITLALIVVIDRLLTLLRHRLELLELTSLRLQWDSLRWQIRQETARVRQDIDELVRGHGNWMPPLARDPKSNLASTPRGHYAGSIIDSCTPTSSTGQGLRLPLLHSQITNIAIRQKHLETIMLSRCGKILDRMIDVAIPLKGLGGINGPSDLGDSVEDEEKEESEAVPDELLDIQDNLENEVGELAERVAWGRELQDQWTRADAHHLASSRALHAAEDVYKDLQAALSETLSDEQHSNLVEDLSQARALLPAAIDKTFPRPSHPDYPEQQVHNSRITEMLTSNHTQASFAIHKCADGVEWYARLLETTRRAKDSQAVVEAGTILLGAALNVVSVGDELLPRPDLENPHSLDSSAISWLAALPSRLAEEKSVREQVLRDNQQLSLATIKLRQVIRSAPKSIRDSVDAKYVTGVLDQAEAVGDALSELARQSSEVTKVVEEEMTLLTLVHSVLGSAKDIRSRLDNVNQDDVDLNRLEETAKAVHRLQEDHRQNVARPIPHIETLVKRSKRGLSALSAHLVGLSDGLDADLNQSKKDVELRLAKMKQHATLSAIEHEAKTFQQEIAQIQISLVEIYGQSLSAVDLVDDVPDSSKEQVDNVRRRVAEWTSSLSSRVSFISGVDNQYVSVNGDIEKSDHESRTRVNEASSRTAAAVKHLVDDLAYFPGTSWTIKVKQSISNLDNVIVTAQEAMSTRTSHGSDVEDLGYHCDAVQSSVSWLSSLVEAEQTLPAVKDHDERETLGKDIERVLASACNSLLELKDATRLSEEQSSPSVEDLEDTARLLLDRLDRLQLQKVINPTTQAIERDPTLRQLPSPKLAKHVRLIVEGTLSDSQHLAVPKDVGDGLEDFTECRTLCKAIKAAQLGITRLDVLVTVVQAVSACDEAFSRLLDACDQHGHTSNDHKLEMVNARARAALNTVREASQDVVGDVRVRAELERLQASWNELDALVEETLHPDRKASTAHRPPSSASTVGSTSQSTLPTEPSSATLHETVTSALTPRLPPIQTPRSASATAIESPGPRIRSVSDSPSGVLRSLGSSTGLPRLRKTSLGPRLTSPFLPSPSMATLQAVEDLSHVKGPRANLPTIPSSHNLSRPTGSPGASRDKARVSSASSHNGRKSTVAHTTYVSDPKSKLDVAVGKIVNKLNVHVPIHPVGLDPARPTVKDEWKDQSGRYWIGADGRAKLCFCRILRSKTVMVRVGGGWVELSKFLLDHFADSLLGWSPAPVPRSTAGLGLGFGSPTPVPSTAASLATPARPRYSSTRPTSPSSLAVSPVNRAQDRVTSTSSRRPAIPTFVTPVMGDTSLADMLVSPTPHPHPPLPAMKEQTAPARSTPPFPSNPYHPTTTPPFEPKTPELGHPTTLSRSTSSTFSLASSPNRSTASPSSTGTASPLVPLNFMRKASESPPFRQREKERLSVGKRSILGRSSSGNALLSPL